MSFPSQQMEKQFVLEYWRPSFVAPRNSTVRLIEAGIESDSRPEVASPYPDPDPEIARQLGVMALVSDSRRARIS